jgi:hypothetical protein
MYKIVHPWGLLDKPRRDGSILVVFLKSAFRLVDRVVAAPPAPVNS